MVDEETTTTGSPLPPAPLDHDPTMAPNQQQPPTANESLLQGVASPGSTVVVVEEPTTDESTSSSSALDDDNDDDHNLVLVENPPSKDNKALEVAESIPTEPPVDVKEDEPQVASSPKVEDDDVEEQTEATKDFQTDSTKVETDQHVTTATNTTLPEGGKLWPFASVRLVASWEDNCSTIFSAPRLISEKSGLPQFAKLQTIASQQFRVPAFALSFSLATAATASAAPLKRITCDEDLADCVVGHVKGERRQQLVLQVDLELATVICVSFPTHDDTKTLSRRVPLQTILAEDGQICYDKLLLTVSESLGTEEFVLTYTLQEQQQNVPNESPRRRTKYFITSKDDLLDALKQFVGTASSELVLTPEIPDQSSNHDEGEEEDQTDHTDVGALPTTLEAKGDEVEVQVEKPPPYVRLSYQGRDGSSVTYPMDSIRDDMDNTRASYWKLIGLATKAFHLGVSGTQGGSPPPICLFYVATDGTKAQVSSDSYLQELMAQRFVPKPLTTELHIRVEPVAVSISTFSNGISIRQFSLSHILYNDGRSVSFSKLVRLARMVDPVMGLIYHNLSGTRNSIGNDNDLVSALQLYPQGDLLIRPTIQQNPFVLSVRDASLSGKKCKIGSWSTPNVMLKSDNAMAVWDLSQMVPGKYQVATEYWRDLNQGPVNVLMGAVLGTDAKTVTKALGDLRLRANLLPRVKLEASGLNESDFTRKILGEVDVRPSFDNAPPGSETCFLAVAVSPEQQDFPDVFVSDLQMAYLGPLETL